MKDRKSIGRKATMHMEQPRTRPDATLGRDVQAKIGQQLRAMYDEVVGQGVPDRFVDLLNRLDNIPKSDEPGEASSR
jgi:hypothetical protein